MSIQQVDMLRICIMRGLDLYNLWMICCSADFRLVGQLVSGVRSYENSTRK